MNTPLTPDQRAIVIGDEGICPECERDVEWHEVDKNWYICHDCVNMMLHDTELIYEKQVANDHN